MEANLADASEGGASRGHEGIEAGAEQKQRQRDAECDSRNRVAERPAHLGLQVHHKQARNLH